MFGPAPQESLPADIKSCSTGAQYSYSTGAQLYSSAPGCRSGGLFAMVVLLCEYIC
jgi:hypothetical protein